MFTEPILGARARRHAALGDVTRLAIADRLGLGDASPGELADAFGLPTNLVAHHLQVLESAGLVERVRSDGDRRRTYVRLLPAALPTLPVTEVTAPRVVFVCTHNSARSQLAAAIWERASNVPSASAGTHPAPRIHSGAIAVARRHRLRLGGGRTAHVDAVIRPDDLLVAVCDSAHEELGRRNADRLHWSVPDPVRIGTDAAFERAWELIEDRVTRLVAAVPD
jgi:ArsR family transcriptional regulator, arsenate/arsenite/antimonite-responsive transcriptional repressor / arsenate reductase (thioredoxin)